MAYKTIDLFAGAGGITVGFGQAGFSCLCATDFDEEAGHTFTYNHPGVPFILKDIRTLSPQELLSAAQCKRSDVDVITGGPPCQGFSLAGLRLTNDPRNVLFREYIRIAKTIKPKVIFFENVPGIMSMQNGDVLRAIINEFSEIGYHCKYSVVNAADYGVPESRPRFVLIGVRKASVDIIFPSATHEKKDDADQLSLFDSGLKPYVTVEEALSDLPPVKQGEGDEVLPRVNDPLNSYQRDRVGKNDPLVIYNHRATKNAPEITKRYSLIPPGCNNSVLPIEIRTKKINAFKLDPNAPSRTVTCNFRTDLINPYFNRGLTVREAARLQSFDDDYRFFGNLTRKAKWLTQDDQVGNAVPPLLAKAFAEQIREYILPQF